MDFRIRCLTFVTVAVLTAPACLAGVEATQETFTISGSVGLPGVTMLGFEGAPVSDEDGRYSVVVLHGWRGTIRPVKEGFAFTPVEKQYASVQGDMENEDYAASLITFTISGGVGLPGVAMIGLPGDPITDARGFYAARVEYGWTGVVTPVKEGYTFDPPEMTYVDLTADQTNGNYMSQALTLTISDRIMLGGEPLGGVTVTADPGEASVITDSEGRYIVEVPYGWTGELILSKPGYVFKPASILYRNLKTNIGEGVVQQATRPASARARATGRFWWCRRRRSIPSALPR